MKSETKPALSWRFEAIGTSWGIASAAALPESVKMRILALIEDFDKAYSRFRPDSLVSRLATEDGKVEFPPSASEIFGLYEELFRLTKGKVTPLVGDSLVAAGYDQKYSLKTAGAPVSAPDYNEVITREGAAVTVLRPVCIDIGALGKGYLVDVVVKLLLEAGYDDFVVDASGDMRVVGDRTEVVGLENPRDTSEVIGTIEINNAALCASAVNRRAWGEWHHVIDPATGVPTEEIVATWAIADTTMLADGLATALFFTDPKTLAAKYNYEYIRVHADGSAEYSEYFAKGVYQ